MANKGKKIKTDMAKYWYYLSEKQLIVDDIRKVLDPAEYNIEIWTEAGVLEIGVAEKASVDIEEWELDPEETFEPGLPGGVKAQSIFGVTIEQEEAAACREAMEKILSALGGIMVSDDETSAVIRAPKKK